MSKRSHTKAVALAISDLTYKELGKVANDLSEMIKDRENFRISSISVAELLADWAEAVIEDPSE